MSATATGAPSPVALRRGRPNGWWGMAIFVSTEATLFGAIVGSYVYLRINTHVWPPRGVPDPAVLGPAVAVAVLALSLFPFRAAFGAARKSARIRALGLLTLATAMQAAVFGVQIHLFQGDLARFTPQQSAYGSIYYVLLGAALAHFAIGLLLDLWLLVRIAERLTPYRLVGLEAVCLYWYVVAALSVVVVLTQLSPRL